MVVVVCFNTTPHRGENQVSAAQMGDSAVMFWVWCRNLPVPISNEHRFLLSKAEQFQQKQFPLTPGINKLGNLTLKSHELLETSALVQFRREREREKHKQGVTLFPGV